VANPDPRLIESRKLLDTDPAKAGEIADVLIEEEVELTNARLVKGLSMMKTGQLMEAGDFFLSHGEDAGEFYINAAAAYRQAGEEKSEIGALTQLLALVNPAHEASYQRLANWAKEHKEWLLARKAFYVLFEIDPTNFFTVFSLAVACKELRQFEQGVTYYLKAVEMTDDPKSRAGAYSHIAGIYKDSGQQEKARTYFEKTYEDDPTPNACSNLIMHMQYMYSVDLQEFYDKCREYNDRFLHDMVRYQHPLKALDPGKAQTGLRIGFMSGDFIGHSLVHLMLEPIKRLAEVAPQHTLTCYHNRDVEDSFSEQYKAAVHQWVNVKKMSDDEVAERIYSEDNIDVLVDLAGHTAGNRLPVFGRKPAPVQVGWISGMMTPPAIETINYFMTDPHIRPESAKRICAEKLIDLPSTCTYFPAHEAPEVGPLPADRNGYVTFGSFNNPCKISDPVLSLWASCLRKVSNSRIHIKVYGKDHERSIRAKLRKLGIADNRVTYIYNLPSTQAVMAYVTEKLDIFLDTFPCAGMLTSAESMWMGCPVVTLYGDTFLHNQSWTLIAQAGLQDELGATSTEQFVERVEALCDNFSRLREIRSTIRERMGATAVRDPLKLATCIIKGIEWTWEDWCNSRKPLQRLSLYGDVPRAVM